MKLLLFFIIFIPSFLVAQDDTFLLKKNFPGTDKVEEEYYILKSDMMVMHGTYTAYHYNGRVFLRGWYELGKREGEWTGYYENGNIETRSHYHRGQYCGTLKYYDPEGKLESSFNMDLVDMSPVFFDDTTFRSTLQKAINYPPKAYKNEIQGNVIVSILRDSACHQLVQLVRGFDYDCDKEAVRAVKQVLSSYSLGLCRNQSLTFPIYFRLGGE